MSRLPEALTETVLSLLPAPSVIIKEVSFKLKSTTIEWMSTVRRTFGN